MRITLTLTFMLLMTVTISIVMMIAILTITAISNITKMEIETMLKTIRTITIATMRQK